MLLEEMTLTRTAKDKLWIVLNISDALSVCNERLPDGDGLLSEFGTTRVPCGNRNASFTGVEREVGCQIVDELFAGWRFACRTWSQMVDASLQKWSECFHDLLWRV
jgi:hypothetical protein